MIDKATGGGAKDDDGDFGVWAENWEVLQLFLACDTQWIRAGDMGIPCGLSYPGVDTVMRWRGIEPSAELHDGLKVMECTAVAEMQKAAERQAKRARH